MAEITLSEAESKAAIDVALAQKVALADAEAAAARVAAEATRAAAEARRRAEEDARNRKKTPTKFVGTWLEGDVVEYYVNANADGTQDRVISVGGKNYEHTHEDLDGVWIYRRM